MKITQQNVKHKFQDILKRISNPKFKQRESVKKDLQEGMDGLKLTAVNPEPSFP